MRLLKRKQQGNRKAKKLTLREQLARTKSAKPINTERPADVEADVVVADIDDDAAIEDDASNDDEDASNDNEEKAPAPQEYSKITKSEKGLLIKAIQGVLFDQCQMGAHFTARQQDPVRHTLRLASLVQWFHLERYKEEVPVDEIHIVKVLKQILNIEYTAIQEYSTYLSEKRLLTPETIMNFMGDLVRCFAWMCLFAPADIKQPMGNNAGIANVVQIVRETQSSRQRRDRSTSHTLDEKVRLRLAPAKGLKELRDAVVSALPWTKKQKTWVKVSYQHFMEVLFSALYLFSPNGRPGGVQSLTLAQGNDLLEHAYTTTAEFKTRSTYGFQPVTIGEAAWELLQLYLEVLRPLVAQVTNNAAALWLRFDGSPDLAIGKKVSSFFMKALGLSITVTTIRDLVETESKAKLLEGKITAQERDSIMSINGHSSATVAAHYLLEDRRKDVFTTRNTFAALMTDDVEVPDADDGMPAEGEADDEDGDDFGGQAPPLQQQHQMLPLSIWTQPPTQVRPTITTGSTSSLSFSQRLHLLRVPPKAADWGRDHPAYRSTTGKAEWTEAEKQYVGQWCSQFERTFPDAKSPVAQCLKHLRKDPEALHIFHQHHVQDSSRLRHGYRSFKNDEAKAASEMAAMEYDA